MELNFSAQSSSLVRLQMLKLLLGVPRVAQFLQKLNVRSAVSVNLTISLGFFSKKCSLESLLKILEFKHHLVTAVGVENRLRVSQMDQKHIKGWKVGLKAEMLLPFCEATSAKPLVDSIIFSQFGSNFPAHMAVWEVSSQRTLGNACWRLLGNACWRCSGLRGIKNQLSKPYIN